MKDFLKKTVASILKSLSKIILKKYRPDIIGVTGSVGKTSTKEAIYAVLSYKFNVRRNIKNYNNEIGLPLTIIGASSGGRSIWDWLGVFIKALVLLLWRDKNYPKILVLEMGTDRPGDMKYLVDLAPCRIGVVTNIGPVHLEFFKTLERIAKEKSIIITHIKNGWAVLNADNKYVAEMEHMAQCRVLTYGIEQSAAIKAWEIKISQNKQFNIASDVKENIAGLSFKLSYGGSAVPVFLPNILGEHLIYSALAGAAVGIIYSMNLVEISQALRAFAAPKGRMTMISGVKETTIIDDTYNAGPDSMIAALKVLGGVGHPGQNISAGRRVAVLGDMLELGSYTVEAHHKAGEAVVKNNVDILITVGERARMIADEAKKLGMKADKIFSFSDSERAGRFLQEQMIAGDYILVKGSQGVRMEKVVKEVMAEPLRAKELLVRQEAPWI